jgi:hypothetical protein
VQEEIAKNIVIKAVSGNITTDVEITRNSSEWEIVFPVVNGVEDTYYDLYYYYQSDNLQDGDGELRKLTYKSGDLKILVTSSDGYAAHDGSLYGELTYWAGTNGVGVQLYDNFITGATNAADSRVLRYTHEELSTDDDTTINDYLVDAWTHGAGADLEWYRSDKEGEYCTGDIPQYSHPDQTPLNDKVMESGKIHDRLESDIDILKLEKFQLAKNSAIPCSNGDCYKFYSEHRDIDIDFIPSVLDFPFPGSNDVDLAAALGSAKLAFKADVRFKEEYLGAAIVYDVKITGYIYDMYDFNYGKETNYVFEFNNDGAWIQTGYEEARRRGSIFITLVPFELQYNFVCDFSETICLQSNGYSFSTEADFNE